MDKSSIKKFITILINYVKVKLGFVFRIAKSFPSRVNKRDIILIFIINIATLIIVASINLNKKSNNIKIPKATQEYPIKFEIKKDRTEKRKPISYQYNSQKKEIVRLRESLDKWLNFYGKKYGILKNRLQFIESQISRLATEQDIKRLEKILYEPNYKLIGNLEKIQKSIKKIQDKTKNEIWINSKVIEHYFTLAAVQGFSDGLRAIIDVSGNQTALSINQICPACRGWVLKKLNFSNQSAIFFKKLDNKIFYVKLKAN